MGRFVLAVLFLIFAGLGIAGWILRAEAMLAVALISAHAPDGPFDAAKAPPAMTGMVLRGDVKRGLSDAQGTTKKIKLVMAGRTAVRTGPPGIADTGAAEACVSPPSQ